MVHLMPMWVMYGEMIGIKRQKRNERAGRTDQSRSAHRWTGEEIHIHGAKAEVAFCLFAGVDPRKFVTVDPLPDMGHDVVISDARFQVKCPMVRGYGAKFAFGYGMHGDGQLHSDFLVLLQPFDDIHYEIYGYVDRAQFQERATVKMLRGEEKRILELHQVERL